MLTTDKRRLSIFDDGIEIDQNLPKWVNAKRRVNEDKEKLRGEQKYEIPFGNDFAPSPNDPSPEEIRDEVLFNEIAKATLNELSDTIYRKKIYKNLNQYYGVTPIMQISSGGTTAIVEHKSWLGKAITSFFSKFRKKDEEGEIDITEFFTSIKALSKESAEKYRDRVTNYLCALYNAKTAGQTALLEQLLREMIANKYEALLDAEGFYYAVREEDVVRFAKKTEKGLKLSYIKNFGRPIPDDVINLLVKANKLEVFDNYVVLYFDPKGEIYKETEQQRAKRKDPILFGVISGSNKLYYIGDWIDEYCDLTLEKFVDTLGTTKETLKIFKD